MYLIETEDSSIETDEAAPEIVPYRESKEKTESYEDYGESWENSESYQLVENPVKKEGVGVRSKNIKTAIKNRHKKLS